MIYRAIGLMSGSSLDGLDICFVEFLENGGKWSYEIIAADCYDYPAEWTDKLKNATNLSALEYQLLHTDYGHYIGAQVNQFIQANHLEFKVGVIASHGHTTFHLPERKMTAQLGDGASIAAETKLPVVCDLRALDVALGGQGAPVVPIGEKLLFTDYHYFLNIGGIANISFNEEPYVAFDVCPANRVMNMLANEVGKEYDADGEIARAGSINYDLLEELNQLDYYKNSYPKSLANNFGIETIYPLIKKYNISINDQFRTYVEHICTQIKNVIHKNEVGKQKMMVTGGGAFNSFLIERLRLMADEENIEVVVPDANLVKYKEAMIMALIGVLRWREENNVLSSVTGALRNSVGGAMWMGQEE